MKKLLLSILGFTLPIAAYSQLVDYEPVIINRNNSSYGSTYYNPYSDPYRSNSRSLYGEEREFRIIGYVYNPNTNNFKRTKIKVKLNNIHFYLSAIYNGKTEKWHEGLHYQVKKIDSLLDSEFIQDNFEWKVEHTLIGTIYFNY